MLVVVVALIVVMVLVHSLFYLMLNFLGLIGSVVLLYCSTHYADRGGDSRRGTYCGIFFVIVYDTASIASWSTGAAL